MFVQPLSRAYFISLWFRAPRCTTTPSVRLRIVLQDTGQEFYVPLDLDFFESTSRTTLPSSEYLVSVQEHTVEWVCGTGKQRTWDPLSE